MVDEMVLNMDLAPTLFELTRTEGSVSVVLLDAEGDLDASVEQELIALREACFRSEDHAEGVRAFLEKRKPDFSKF